MIDIGWQLDTVKRVIYINEEGISTVVSVAQNSTSWTVKSFEEVGKLGAEAPVDATMPLPSDVAVIMYTSGSTGLPKVRLWLFIMLQICFCLHESKGPFYSYLTISSANKLIYTSYVVVGSYDDPPQCPGYTFSSYDHCA